MNRTAVQERQQATGSGQPPGAPAAPCRLPAAEPDDPRNGLLDAFEQFVEALDANDLRAPMVARIKRMFPEIVPPPAAPVPAPRADEPATLKLGDINARIAPLKLDAAGMAELGIQPARSEGSAKLYRESDFDRLLRGIVKHIQVLQQVPA